MTFTTHSTAIAAPLSIANSLNDEHLTQSESRGLLNDYTRATCRSITHSEAKVYVGITPLALGFCSWEQTGKFSSNPTSPGRTRRANP
jgi:hypothetical protein